MARYHFVLQEKYAPFSFLVDEKEAMRKEETSRENIYWQVNEFTL